MAEIDKAMNYFWDLLEGVPGIRAHRPSKGSNTTMGGWFAANGLYVPEELGGLSVTRFCEAVSAEGARGVAPGGCNNPLHLHPLFNTLDIYKHGKPTNSAYLPKTPVPTQSLPVAEGIQVRTFAIPGFKHFRKKIIKEHAEAFKKVAENYKELLAGDKGNNLSGKWGLANRK